MFDPPPQVGEFNWIWQKWLNSIFEWIRTRVLSTDASGNTTLPGDIYIPTKTPSSASDTGTLGTVTWDADYIYICTATDTWKRVAIATWPQR